MSTSNSDESAPASMRKEQWQISLVAKAGVKTAQHFDPEEIVEWIRSDKLREPIQKIRDKFAQALRSGQSQGLEAKNLRSFAKAQVSEAKKKLPGVMWSGRFSKREKPVAEKLLKHSGLLCADLDELGERLPEIREGLVTSPHVLALFTSPTGDGLKAVFRVPADAEHKASFLAVQAHVRDLCGIEVDESCSDVGRLCFLSHDPDIYYKPDAVALPVTETTQVERTSVRSRCHQVGGLLVEGDIFNPVPDLIKRREIAEALLGEFDWQEDTEGFCTCPGEHLHTTGNKDSDCIVYLGSSVPTIKCFHNHCTGLVAGANHELRSRIEKTERDAGKADKQDATSEQGALIQLSTVEMKPTVFVDKPLFQANAFHLLVGKKNAGKGTFLSYVAAQFTRGELGENYNVMWIVAGEDSLSLDVRPRIEAAGGDTARVYCPSVTPILPEAAAQLRAWIDQVGHVGLIVMDPISGMVPPKFDPKNGADVRKSIASLNALADETKCVIIGVRHLKKDASQGALDSVLDSVEWVNVPRAVLAIVKDDEDEAIRHVQVLTGNRVPNGTNSRSFRIVGVDIVAGGEPVAKAELVSNDGKDVDEILTAEKQVSNSQRNQAKVAILDILEACEDSCERLSVEGDIFNETGMLSDELSTTAQEACGASKATINKAKGELREAGLIQFEPLKDESGKVQQWWVRRTHVKRPVGLRSVTAARGERPLKQVA